MSTYDVSPVSLPSVIIFSSPLVQPEEKNKAE